MWVSQQPGKGHWAGDSLNLPWKFTGLKSAVSCPQVPSSEHRWKPRVPSQPCSMMGLQDAQTATRYPRLPFLFLITSPHFLSPYGCQVPSSISYVNQEWSHIIFTTTCEAGRPVPVFWWGTEALRQCDQANLVSKRENMARPPGPDSEAHTFKLRASRIWASILESWSSCPLHPLPCPSPLPTLGQESNEALFFFLSWALGPILRRKSCPWLPPVSQRYPEPLY